MATLYLMRHATAAASGPDGTDHSRPLSPKGRQEAEAIGKFLRRTGITLDLAGCSTAARAQETAELVLRSAGLGLKPLGVPELYNGTGNGILQWVQGRPAATKAVFVVAHMPGVAEFVSLLATDGSGLAMGFSPGTLVTLGSEAKVWADWGPGRGSLELVMPAANAARA